MSLLPRMQVATTDKEMIEKLKADGWDHHYTSESTGLQTFAWRQASWPPDPNRRPDNHRRNRLRRLIRTLRENAVEMSVKMRHWRMSHGHVYVQYEQGGKQVAFDVASPSYDRGRSVYWLEPGERPANFGRYAMRHIAATNPAAIIEFCAAVEAELEHLKEDQA